MANPRSLVYALYTHWDTVEVLVRLSREFAVLTSDQVLGCIAKVSPQLDAEAQGGALRAMVNADIAQRQILAMVARDMDQRLRHPVDEGLGTDKPVIGQHVGTSRHMLAAAETDFEMQRTILSEQACRRHVAFDRNGDLRQQRIDQILLTRTQGLAL